ncbi:MAG: TerB family tellurite resistance protein [Kofleriaceae bacterium]
MTPNVAKCLVVSSVLVADGMMTEDERAFLTELMQSLGRSEDERAQVVEFEGVDEAHTLVTGLPAEERQAIVEQLVDAAAADAKLSPHELAAIKRVSTALGL